MFFGGLLAATLALPAVAQAKMAAMPKVVSPPQSQNQIQFNSNRALSGQVATTRGLSGNEGSIGGGMQGENEPGHNAGPGSAKIDDDSRGPVNDVQVGRGTEDVPQSKNPPPAR
jgi:hypothetical protein